MKNWLKNNILLILLVIFVLSVSGVYAAIQQEVSLYSWESVSAKWLKLNVDTAGNLKVKQVALSNTTDTIAVYPPDPGYAHISTNISTQVKSGTGYLYSISINTAGISANTATVYDNTSCTAPIIAIIDTTAIGNIDMKGLKFSTGLCITTATGTASDLTVVYK